ncbi:MULTISPECIES: M16 family metallopeptidase [Thiorhodovibrio]|uniref:M16 family metallopeptidase n=1 Tax=Thiorhodovibrio TaxID=61593 RepID=UPI001913EBA0|nr:MULTISPECIES: pitrilysin family protein [Thiorhodovibrio]MBK5969625.1 peptidase M16 [Thiorhodovibrio winogradskyi]WPL14693.1 protease3 [Thiorhodovibrio litoralis]
MRYPGYPVLALLASSLSFGVLASPVPTDNLPEVKPTATAAESAPASQPQVLEPKVLEKVLDNGLKVLVKPDHRAPIVTSQVWYKVGSSFEHGGITGISHLLEHMMFKGTENLAPGEFSRIIAANGGDENAFTGRDYTAYFQTLADDRLEISFELEAERMRRLALPAEEFAKELEVVKEERRLRTDDDPESLTFERFNAAAYEASPYRIPVIGWASDLESVQVEDLRAWYRRWYAPNNATLVVVGDVEPDAVFALAEKHFGPLQAEAISTPKPRTEPEQLGTKSLTVEAPAKEPYLLFGYKTPALRDLDPSSDQAWEAYALEMLAAVIDDGASSRFSRNLVRGQQVAAAVDASYSAFSRLSGMLLFDGTPAKGKTIAELEQAMLAEIEQLREEPVTDAELERIRNGLIAGKIYEQDSVFYQAMLLGQLETVGLGWQLADDYVRHLAAVTPEQIQAVAQKYIQPENRTRAVLEPQPIDEAAQQASAATAVGGYQHVR